MGSQLGEKILKLLKHQGMTQKQFADRLNTTEATISRYVSGERAPKADMIANMATVLNTTSDYLLGIENDSFDFPRVKRVLTRNATKMTESEKRELINALFGEV